MPTTDKLCRYYRHKL